MVSRESNDGFPIWIPTTNRWASKLGAFEDIEHDNLEGLSGEEYGTLTHYIYNAAGSWALRDFTKCMEEAMGNLSSCTSEPEHEITGIPDPLGA